MLYLVSKQFLTRTHKSLILLHKSRKRLPGSAVVANAWEGGLCTFIISSRHEVLEREGSAAQQEKGFISGNDLAEVSPRAEILGRSLSSESLETARQQALVLW